MFIDMHVKDFIAYTRTVQQFRSVEQSWDMESYYYFRLPIGAAVTSFKLEIGDDHAIQDETRPSKEARKLYNKAVHNKTPAAILKEVGPGIYQADLGRIPPDVQVTIVVKYAQRVASNDRGELIINYPAVTQSIRSSCSEDTKIVLNIEIIQIDSIRTISSPTHHKLLSIKAGVVGAAREIETFTSFQRETPASSLEQPNQATVSLSGGHTVFDKDLELAIRTSNEAQKTAASLSATNRFGHAMLTITIRPCDLFSGDQDTEWSVGIELNHPWKCCSSDLSELNLTRIPHHGANLSPSTYKFVQSPKIIPKISHLQSYSVYFLLDFKGSTEYSLESVRITALPTSGSQAVKTKGLNVERTHEADGISQKLCVSSILQDLYATMMSQDYLQLYSEGRSFGLPSFVTSAERLGQMYSVCSRWTSKVAADSICDSDDDADSNGPRLYEDELSRLTLPTHLSPPYTPATIWTPRDGQPVPEGLEPTKESSRKYSAGFPLEVGSNRPESGETSPPAMDQKPSREGYKTTVPPCNRHNEEYFVPGDGIDREVITADITRYLGNDALVRPGTFVNKEDGRAMRGYFITGYRNLTSEMIADLKADSARWEQERRTMGSGAQYTPQATDPDNGMASTLYPGYGPAHAPAYPNASNYPNRYFRGANMCVPAQPQESFNASRQDPYSLESYEAQQIWLQIAASRSVDGMYALSANLRDRISDYFNPGTREWLVTRIAPSLSGENGALALEAAADAILILAFVKIYVASRYQEIGQDLGLILKSGRDQREILEELVLRVRVLDNRPRRI